MLNFLKRTAERKSEAKKLRRAGKIPAILYGKGKDVEAIAVDEGEFTALLRQVKQGHLATTTFNLVDESGKKLQAIVKDIQYNPTTYKVIHLDFELLHKDTPVNVNVPIELVGTVDCIGVKLGGVLRQVIRFLRVRCLPGDMPESFPLDVKTLDMRQSRRLKDLIIPETVRPLANLNEVAVVIAKR